MEVGSEVMSSVGVSIPSLCLHRYLRSMGGEEQSLGGIPFMIYMYI